MLTVRIRRLTPHVPLPEYQTIGAAGFDLAASEDTRVGPGEVALVPTGLVIRVPDGYFLGYCGAKDEIRIQVMNVTREPVVVKAGDRIAQGLFMPVARATWDETHEDLRDGSRGGFGATG